MVQLRRLLTAVLFACPTFCQTSNAPQGNLTTVAFPGGVNVTGSNAAQPLHPSQVAQLPNLTAELSPASYSLYVALLLGVNSTASTQAGVPFDEPSSFIYWLQSDLTGTVTSTQQSQEVLLHPSQGKGGQFEPALLNYTAPVLDDGQKLKLQMILMTESYNFNATVDSIPRSYAERANFNFSRFVQQEGLNGNFSSILFEVSNGTAAASSTASSSSSATSSGSSASATKTSGTVLTFDAPMQILALGGFVGICFCLF